MYNIRVRALILVKSTELIHTPPVLHVLICVYVCVWGGGGVILCNFIHVQIRVTTINRIQNEFITTKISLYNHTSLRAPHLSLLATTNPFSVSIILSFLECSPNGIMQYMTFGNQLLSLRIMPLRSIQAIVVHTDGLFPPMAESYFLLWLSRTGTIVFHPLKDACVVSLFDYYR